MPALTCRAFALWRKWLKTFRHYVPAEYNFLSFALAYAETIGAEQAYIGVNALDYSGYR